MKLSNYMGGFVSVEIEFMGIWVKISAVLHIFNDIFT